MQRSERGLFIFIVVFHLLYIWQQKYFLTADGPAHVYNSKILLDILQNKSVDFYLQFYHLKLQLFPNWFSHAALVLLMAVFNPIVAEKILLSIYIILFPFSFWFAVKQISGKAGATVFLVFPFVLHFLFYFGFYNYCFSISFALLLIGSWKKFRNRNIPLQVLVLFPLSFLVFITHIFGWFIAGIVLGGIFLIETASDFRKESLRVLFTGILKRWAVLSVAGIISVGAALLFMHQNVGEIQYWPEKPDRLKEVFSKLEMLVLWGTDREFLLVQWFVYLIVLLFVVVVFKRIVNKEGIRLSDTWLICAVVFSIIYFAQPKALFLAGFWLGRMSWLGWFFLAIWLSSFRLPVMLERTVAGIVVVLVLLLAIERFPLQQKTSDALSDYLSAIEKIPAHSTVLPLSFSNSGIDEEGNAISEHRSQFRHAFDYSGAFKPMINYANYEATTSWFPVQWKSNCNPTKKLNRGAGIEAQPPDANLNFSDTTQYDYRIDYVVTWCMASADSHTEQWNSVNRQLQESYFKIYESPSNRTVVWERKTL